jgi:CRISPR-associated protein Csb1
MSNGQVKLERFDEWLKENSAEAALVMRQWLEPVEGKDTVIFPPTYAPPEGMRREGWLGYNIDRLPDESCVCQIDSVGSQANRMEPIFKRERYKHLVPQVIISAGKREIHLLDAGHRAADAIVRFAGKMEGETKKDAKSLGQQLWDAFKEWQEHANAEPLSRIAPTSLVFGTWDSRATQAKVPRVVRSVIRAYGAVRLTRSAQFTTPLHYVDEGLIDESLDKGEGERNPLAQEGFRHNPATGAPGGVLAKEIRRDVILNLSALRALLSSPNGDRNLKLGRYIVGLALVALTHRSDDQFNLREGCLLRIEKPSSWQIVPFEGDRRDVTIDHQEMLSFTEKAAAEFSVQKFDKPFLFDSRKADQWLKLKKDDRDKRRRQGPVIE